MLQMGQGRFHELLGKWVYFQDTVVPVLSGNSVPVLLNDVRPGFSSSPIKEREKIRSLLLTPKDKCQETNHLMNAKQTIQWANHSNHSTAADGRHGWNCCAWGVLLCAASSVGGHGRGSSLTLREGVYPAQWCWKNMQGMCKWRAKVNQVERTPLANEIYSFLRIQGGLISEPTQTPKATVA